LPLRQRLFQRLSAQRDPERLAGRHAVCVRCEFRPGEFHSGLIRDVGFDPVDAGPLRIARYTEPFTMLVAQLAYEGAGGPELAYRFERFGK